MWYWHVFVQACDLTTTQAVTAFVEIDYYCELYARIAGVTAPDTAFEALLVQRERLQRHLMLLQGQPVQSLRI